MSVCSLEWLAGLLLLSAVIFHLRSRGLRQGLLALCNAGFVATLLPGMGALVTLAVFLLSGFLTAQLLLRFPRRGILAAYLILLTAAFLILKQYDFVTWLFPAAYFQNPVAVVGLSYIFFRQIHTVVDASQGQITDLSLWNYLNYQLNLFSFIAGPIQRFQDFVPDWSRMQPVLTDAEGILRAYLRVFTGILKVTVAGAACYAVYKASVSALLSSPATAPFSLKDTARFLGMFYIYPVYVYFNFSGYCDVVIGGARLTGLRLPENFDRPFLSRNMIEYWTRWHKTLGFWVRDYLFTPLYRVICKWWPRKASYLAFLCYFVAIFVVGVWHGSTWNFVIFGLLNGAGVAVVKLWEMFLIKKGGRSGLRKYLQRRWIHAAAVALNFHFLCFTVLFFPADLDTTFRILRRAVAFF